MEKSFESSLAELEKIVHNLEDGDMPLEKSLELFEKGVKLARNCRERLDSAEKRIQVLMRDESGELVLEEILEDDDE